MAWLDGNFKLVLTLLLGAITTGVVGFGVTLSYGQGEMTAELRHIKDDLSDTNEAIADLKKAVEANHDAINGLSNEFSGKASH